MARRLSAFRGVDEPALGVAGIKWWVSLWYGDVRDWRLGFECNQRNQNPHHRFYLGPLCFGWFTDKDPNSYSHLCSVCSRSIVECRARSVRANVCCNYNP